MTDLYSRILALLVMMSAFANLAIYKPYAVCFSVLIFFIVLFVVKMQLTNRTFLAMVSFLIFLISFIYVLNGHTNQIGDFGVYYRCGNLMYGNEFNDLAVSCKGAYLNDSVVYLKRSIFYLYLYSIFGGSYFFLKLYNLILLTITVSLLYLTFKYRGVVKASMIAAVFFLLITILHLPFVANPDNLTPLIQLLFILSISHILVKKNFNYEVILNLVLLFVTITYSGLARDLTVFFVLAVIYISLSNVRRVPVKILSMLLFAGIAAIFAEQFIVRNLFHASGTGSVILKILSSLDITSFPPQNAVVQREWYDFLYPEVQHVLSQHSYKWFLARFLDEFFVQFNHYLIYVFAKIGIMFDFIGNYSDAVQSWQNNVDNVYIYDSLNYVLSLNSDFFSVITSLLIIFSITSLFKKTCSVIHSNAIKLFLCIALPLVLVLPVLPRYSTVLVMPLFIMSSYSPVFGGRAVSFSWNSSGAHVKKSMYFIVSLMSVYFLIQYCSKYYTLHNRRPIYSVVQQQPSYDVNFACNLQPVPIWKYFDRRMRSKLDPGVDCVSFVFNFEQNVKNVSFIVTQSALEDKFNKLSNFEFSYKINDGQSYKWRQLNTPVMFNVAYGTEGPVKLEIFIRRIMSDEPIEFEIRDILAFP